MERQTEAVLFLHGLGGSAEEARHYRPLFPDCDVIGLDYHGIAPWDAGSEIRNVVLKLRETYQSVSLIGNSLGAFLAMYAGIDTLLSRAYFISPVVDMETLILAQMAQDGVTEEMLKEKGTIPGSSGPALSWKYLCFVRTHPIDWRVPTAILYAEHDNLTPYGTIKSFAAAHNARLTVMPGGEHWFHTEEQMAFLDDWFRRERERGSNMEFRHFSNSDYEAVCDFLIELNRADRTHIHWNWARFEWMYEHPEFDKSARDAIGLWFDGERVVGAAIYDMYFGEAFCGVLPEYAALYPEVLGYAYDALKDETGLAIAICDGNAKEIEAAKTAGFAPIEQTETIMRIDLDRPLSGALPAEFRLYEPDPKEDAEALQWLFWQGFDHGEDRAEFEREEQIEPQVRKHMRRELGIAAVDETGEYAAFCSLWFSEKTDYAYVEPVCTIPRHRGKGLAKALLYEALNRARLLGAKTAYVISDMPFYEKLGFRKTFHYTFYRKA